MDCSKWMIPIRIFFGRLEPIPTIVSVFDDIVDAATVGGNVFEVSIKPIFRVRVNRIFLLGAVSDALHRFAVTW